jgi:hypothetical protein
MAELLSSAIGQLDPFYDPFDSCMKKLNVAMRYAALAWLSSSFPETGGECHKLV